MPDMLGGFAKYDRAVDNVSAFEMYFTASNTELPAQVEHFDRFPLIGHRDGKSATPDFSVLFKDGRALVGEVAYMGLHENSADSLCKQIARYDAFATMAGALEGGFPRRLEIVPADLEQNLRRDHGSVRSKDVVRALELLGRAGLARIIDGTWRPAEVRQRQVFGLGMAHICEGRIDWPELDLSVLPDHGASIPAGVRTQIEAELLQLIEEELLRAGPGTFRAAGFDHAASDHDQRFVDDENRVGALIAEHRLTGDSIDLAVRGADFSDIQPPLLAALERIGMTFDEFAGQLTERELIRFIDDLPTRYVTNVMRSAKHRQGQQKWEPNDFIDVVSLPVAAAYCDVVVTEKQWVHQMRQGKVDQRYDTVLLSDIADLTGVLVKASMLS